MTLFFKDEWFTLYHGDCRDMSDVPDNSVQALITSPPYHVGKEYEAYLTSLKDYLAMLAGCWSQAQKKLATGAFLIINIAHNPKLDTPSFVSVQLASTGWQFRDNIIWKKITAASPRFGSFVQHPYATYYYPNTIYEHILIYTKGEVIKKQISSIDLEWAKEFRNDVWEMSGETKDVGHEAPYPLSLVEPLITFYTNEGDTVIDPFIGSGTTAIACKKLKRKCIGFELEEKYCKLAVERYADYH